MVIGIILQVSTLSTPEFVNLVGNYNFILSGSKEEIDPGLKDKGYSPEALAILEAKTRRATNAVTSLGLRYDRHLSNYKFPYINYALTAFQNYERGVLPYPGSLSEQPAQIIEILQVIGSIRAEHEARMHADIERKNKRHNVRR